MIRQALRSRRLVGVLHETHLGELRAEIVVGADRLGRMAGVTNACQEGLGLAERPAFVHPEIGGALVHAAMAPDPEFALRAVGKEFGLAAIVRGNEEQAAVRAAVRLQHEHAAGLAAAGKIREVAVGPEAIRRVVGANALRAGRYDQVRPGVRARDRVASGFQNAGLRMPPGGGGGVQPSAGHELDQRSGRLGVVGRARGGRSRVFG